MGNLYVDIFNFTIPNKDDFNNEIMQLCENVYDLIDKINDQIYNELDLDVLENDWKYLQKYRIDEDVSSEVPTSNAVNAR
jgi:hypothetical protein